MVFIYFLKRAVKLLPQVVYAKLLSIYTYWTFAIATFSSIFFFWDPIQFVTVKAMKQKKLTAIKNVFVTGN